MTYRLHPIMHVASMLERSNAETIQYSIYRYKPQTILDTRQIFELSVSELSEAWLDSVISTLGEGQELALHSCYRVKKTLYHIPMIDLDCPPDELEFAKKELFKILPNKIFSGLKFYDSGRSLHGYGSYRMSRKEWTEFMGRLLLANMPSAPPVVDSRWVGHRLIGGYSSLRWSANSNYYLKLPELIN